MDSGNSGSLQSSSGGDEEYDSRAAAAFFPDAHPPPHAPPSQPPQQQFFNPFSSYMQISHDPSLLNPNPAWPGPEPPRSDPIPPQSTSQAAARNPKKRSRASRRAPTTVLTTDTNNFRAMVQEFTGIPAQPFSSTTISSSYFPRNSLDLFGVRSAVHKPPPYLRRPFAQKAAADLSPPPPPFQASPSTTTTHVSSSVPTTTLQQQSSNLFNSMNQNPQLLMSSLLQSNPRFVFPSSSSVMASKLPHNDQHEGSFEIPSNSYMKVGGLDEFGLGHGNHVNGLPNLVSSDQVIESKNAERWRSNIGLIMNSTNNEDDEYRRQDQMKAHITGDEDYYGLSRDTMSNGKVNNAASSSSLNGEKGSENLTTRGDNQQGMVESWINCSSE